MRNPNLEFHPDGWTRDGDGGPLTRDPRIQFQTASQAAPGGGGGFRNPDIEFQPDSWIRSGDAYSGNAAAFTSTAQQVLDSTTSLSTGGANPLDAAVSSILSEMSATGTGVISSISGALDGIGGGMISTGLNYRNLEAEQTSTAGGARGSGS